MAALQSIRNHPVLLTTILGGGLILMIIMFGFDDYNGLFQGDRDTVLSVNGNPVKHSNYEAARQRKSEFIKRTQNVDASSAEISRNINNQTYNEFLQEEILSDIYANTAISVSSYELGELTSGKHISPVMSQLFGEQAAQYGMMFAQMEAEGFQDNETKYMWDEIKEQIVKARKAQKLTTLLATAVKPNKLEAEDAFNQENVEVAFDYVALPSYQVADSLVKVSSSDVKSYYESHKSNFKLSSDLRDIAYIAVDLHPSNEDREAVLATMQKNGEQFANGNDIKDLVNSTGIIDYVDAHLNNNTFRGELKEFVENNPVGAVKEPAIYNGDILNLLGGQSGKNESLNEYYYTVRIMDKVNAPDSVKLVFAPVPAAQADSMYAVIKEGKLDEQAQWATEAMTIGMDEDLQAKLFAPVARNSRTEDLFKKEINGNVVIVKVLERTANVAKSKVAVYAERIASSSKTRRYAYGELNDFINTFTTVQAMQDSAITRGFRMIPTTLSTTAYNIGNVEDAREAVRFAFEGEKNDISKIYEFGDHLLLVAITGDVQSGYQSVNNKNVTASIESQVLPEKKVAYLVANNFANADKSSLEACAQAVGAEVRNASRVSLSTSFVSGLGSEPAVIGQAVKAEEGAIVGPIAGTNSAVLLKVTSKKNKELTYDEANYLTKAASSVLYRNPVSAVYNALVREANVEDNRLRFF